MRIPSLSWLLLAWALAGCGSLPTLTHINETYDPNVHRRLAVLPFDSKYADGRSMSDAFITHLMTDGFSVVDRGALEGLDLGAPLEALGAAQLKKVKESGIDGIVFGSIDAKKPGTEIDAVSLRMVDTRNGAVIFSTSFKNEKQLPANQIPQLMADDIGKELKRLAKRRFKEERRRQKLAQRNQKS